LIEILVNFGRILKSFIMHRIIALVLLSFHAAGATSNDTSKISAQWSVLQGVFGSQLTSTFSDPATFEHVIEFSEPNPQSPGFRVICTPYNANTYDSLKGISLA
jgi:hypothetical protein